MDEEQINELLECSVCLEQLDQTCKVLPCQHTYCRRCLDEIVLTKFELRCPECRMIITTPVAELPSNIFVMRILERLKNHNRPKPSTVPSLSAGVVVNHVSGHGGSVGSSPSHGHGLGLSPHRHLPRDGLTGSQVAGHLMRQNQPFAKALYTYESTEREDLPFKKGNMIILKRQIDDNWYLGELGGKTGYIPANFVRVMIPLPQVPQCKALYDFDLKDENEKDCLAFKKDEVITVIRRVDENWLEGRQGDKIGIFPISFVELNDTARRLVNSKSNNVSSSGPTISTSSSSSSSSPPPIPPPLTMPSSSTSLSSSTSIPSTTVNNAFSSSTHAAPVVNRSNSCDAAEVTTSILSSPSSLLSTSLPPASATAALSLTASSIQNPSPQNKRHSYAPTSTCSSPLPIVDSTQQRHSLEVTPDSFTPTVSSSTSSTAAGSSLPLASHASSLEHHSLSNSSLTSVDSGRNSATASPSISPTPIILENGPASQASVNSGGANSQPGSLAPPIYVALYNYHPQKEDELVLHKGDHYNVVEKCQDGWFKGSCIKNGKMGVFPGNYVSIVRHSSAFKPMNPNILNIRAKCPGAGSTSSSSSPGVPPAIPPPMASSSSSSSSSSTCHPSNGSGGSVCRRLEEPVLDSSVTSGPPPLKPRVAKMTVSSSKPGQGTKSHLMAVPMRSISVPSSSSTSAPMADPSNKVSSSSSSHVGPTLFTSSSSQRNKTWVSSHHHLQPQHQPSAVTSMTTPPPNVVMASSHDASSSLLQLLNKDKDKKKKKDEKKKGGFLNLLKEKTSKFTSSPSTDSEHQSPPVVSLDAISHTRSGSFPAESNASSSVYHMGPPVVEHRKAQSLDSTCVLLPSPPVPDKPSTGQSLRTRRNKYCCVVPYPPQMNYELDLEVGDIVYVIRTREDGWYKGTQERTGKTGMFPASFVEKCD